MTSKKLIEIVSDEVFKVLEAGRKFPREADIHVPRDVWATTFGRWGGAFQTVMVASCAVRIWPDPYVEVKAS